MSIRIALTDAPEFYTNLDVITGRVVLSLSRPEQLGAIIVKLEGESRTALTAPSGEDNSGRAQPGLRRLPPGAYDNGPGSIVHENHKILYRVAQVFPDETAVAMPAPIVLPPGQHEFPFRFKVPFNNACSDPHAMAKIGGLVGAGGYATGPGIFGLGGIRVMDGSKQLLYQHVTKTLPPSFTGFPRQAEIRYFIKVTVQRPGLFKENWRYNIGFKFLPIEPPRSPTTSQEAYARRPFTFQPRTPGGYEGKGKRASIFAALGQRTASSGAVPVGGSSASAGRSASVADAAVLEAGLPPSVEMSARLPHPSVLTCNHPIPLRLIAKKLAPSREMVYLVSLQIDLIGTTEIRCQDLANTETTRWVVVSHTSLSIPLGDALSPVGTESVVPPTLWRDSPLPNTVMPTFVTCNLRRAYKLELKLGLSWGRPGGHPGRKGSTPSPHAQALFLPLVFSAVDVFSGMALPPAVVKALASRPSVNAAGPGGKSSRPPRRPSAAATAAHADPNAAGPSGAEAAAEAARPPLPPRTGTGGLEDESAPPYVEAPPSYDEAMAEEMTGPVFPAGQARPAYSGVTNENAPLTIPEKS